MNNPRTQRGEYFPPYNHRPDLQLNLQTLGFELFLLHKMFKSTTHVSYLKSVKLQIRNERTVLPDGADRWVLIPDWTLFASTYARAVAIVFDAINRFSLNQFHDSGIGPEKIKLSTMTEKGFHKIRKEQSSMRIVPIQIGQRYRGLEPDRAIKLFREDEFPLDVFSIGIILLTHPEILDDERDPSIICVGNMTFRRENRAGHLPTYRFDKKLMLSSIPSYIGSKNFVIPTGFLPKKVE